MSFEFDILPGIRMGHMFKLVLMAGVHFDHLSLLQKPESFNNTCDLHSNVHTLSESASQDRKEHVIICMARVGNTRRLGTWVGVTRTTEQGNPTISREESFRAGVHSININSHCIPARRQLQVRLQ